MATDLPFFIVDVFAEEKYAGNQLAVFLDLEKRLSAAQMLQITREINFAESTFVRSVDHDGAYGVRIFTTQYEVPFAGHPSLGSAYVIAKHLMRSPEPQLVLRLKKGDIPIQIDAPDDLEGSRFTMEQAQPDFGPEFSADEISGLLGTPKEALDTSMPFQEVSTGLPYLILFLRDLEAIQNIRLNDEKVVQFMVQHQLHRSNSPSELTTSLFLVSTQTVEEGHDYHTRMFALDDGKLWEDAATGSANGCFLAYLLRYQKKERSAIVEQGYEMGRRSILYLDGNRMNDKYTLNVGGRVVPIAQGKWHVQ